MAKIDIYVEDFFNKLLNTDALNDQPCNKDRIDERNLMDMIDERVDLTCSQAMDIWDCIIRWSDSNKNKPDDNKATYPEFIKTLMMSNMSSYYRSSISEFVPHAGSKDMYASLISVLRSNRDSGYYTEELCKRIVKQFTKS